MCITYFYLGSLLDHNSPYKFIQVFNREEAWGRSTQPLDSWEEDRNIVAGKDMLAGGTWLGVNIKTGNVAFLTNIAMRHLSSRNVENLISRGGLISNFLRSDFFEKDMLREERHQMKEHIRTAMDNYLKEIEEAEWKYKGFNLVIGNVNIMEFKYLGNDRQSKGIVDLKSGAYGMENRPFFQESERTAGGFNMFNSLVVPREKINEDQHVEGLMAVAESRFKFPYSKFEKVTVNEDGKKEVVKTSVWATKTTSLILIDQENNLKFMEITYDDQINKKATVVKEFKIERLF